jgi:energy-coupling factor transport system permease protein
MQSKLAYKPGRTLLHQLNPITKLIWLLVGSITFFFLQDGIWHLVAAVFFLLILIAVYPHIYKVRGFRLAIITALALFILYLLFDKTGSIYYFSQIPLLRITSGGLASGLMVCGRFLSIVFLSYCFILTTEPAKLAYGLMKAGIPYRFAFMLVMALRLSPLLEEEGQTIYQAQLMRGIQYDQKNLKRLFLMIQQFLSPVLINALRRVDKLVFSMEGRGFGRYPTRTFRQKAAFSFLDLTAIILLGILMTLILVTRYGGTV